MEKEKDKKQNENIKNNEADFVKDNQQENTNDDSLDKNSKT